MSKKFDPNLAADQDSGIFGLPYTKKESKLVYIPVPWEATTSYGGGTSFGPSAIFEASKQVDLFDYEILKPYEAGLYMMPISKEVLQWNRAAKKDAQKIIAVGGRIENDRKLVKLLDHVNKLGKKVNHWVLEQTKSVLSQNKIPAIIGGDHSVPFGAFQAVAQKYSQFGVLHFDAHSDTRIAYEGFEWSHASIMYNALTQIPQIKKLVQVGIRDFCEQEFDFCESQGKRVDVFYDQKIAALKFKGVSWNQIVEKVIQNLPKNVWISFDIDGLDPVFCPNTGTPVPGGLSFYEAVSVIAAVVRSGRKIIGFDLNEVSPPDEPSESEWDANVGARLLYKLTGWTLASQGFARVRSGGIESSKS